MLHNAVITLWAVAGDRPADLPQLRTMLQARFNGVARPEFAGARVLLADNRIVFIPGGDNPAVRFRFNSGPSDGAIDLSANAQPNVAAYQLGIGPTLQAQSGAVPGADGTQPSAIDLAGSRSAKTGLFALENVDLFNILIIPNQSDPSLLAGAIAYAEERRSFVLLDLPATIDTLDEATNWLTSNAGLRHRNAAAYFPRARFADPLQANRVRSFANSGAIAGVYARTGGTRGVWKAPAGIEAGLRGARGLDYVVTDPENGVINPLGLNALRSFPAFGIIAWGARTLLGSDALASEWKYVPVRRLALFIEESLYRGTQWVVFEPNAEPLWAQIRLNVGAFMNNLFRQGAFQGASPRDAYLVKCDSTTTTQDDINLGIVNIIVGFAPLKPAEFVIIKLQQLAGQAGRCVGRRNMAQFSVNAQRFDPYKNFKFRVKWDGRYVAGISKVGALKRSVEVVEHREGGDPSTGRKSPGRTKFEAITLERGVTHDVEFEGWANKVWNLGSGLGAEVSLSDFRKDILIELYNEAGQLAKFWKVFRCWVSEFQSLPDLDANANAVAIETIKLENEGWERDLDVTEPTEPTFNEPER